MNRAASIHPSPGEMPPRSPGRAWGIVFAVVVALVLIYWLRIILLPFVLAAAIAYVVAPIISQLQKRLKLPHWAAALIIFVLFLALLTAVGFWLDRVLIPEAAALVHDAPQLIDALFRKLFGSNHVNFLGHELTPDILISAALGSAQGLLGNPAEAIAGAMAGVMMAFVTIVLVFFFLISGPRLARGAFWLIPPATRPSAMRVAVALKPVIRRYIEGVVIVVLITSILSWIGLRLVIGLPHATLLAITVGLLELIPVVGPIASATLLCMVAVTRGSLAIIIGVGLFVLAIRLLIDQLVGPIVLGSAVRLHPAIIIFALMVGGTMFGVLGMRLAVPAAASVKVALQICYDDEADEAIGS
jgi:predicted PurR-regulated permease PerM